MAELAALGVVAGCGGIRSAWLSRHGWPPCSSVHWSPTGRAGDSGKDTAPGLGTLAITVAYLVIALAG